MADPIGVPDDATNQEYSHLQAAIVTGELAGSIGHEMNNLLATLQGYVQLMRLDSTGAGAGPGAADQAARLEEMVAALDRAAGLVRDLRLLSRRRYDDDRHCQVQHTITSVVSWLRRIAPSDVAVTREPARWDALVECDPARLQQSLLSAAIALIRYLAGAPGTISFRSFADSLSPPRLEGDGGNGQYSVVEISCTPTENGSFRFDAPLLSRSLAGVAGLLAGAGGGMTIQRSDSNVYLDCRLPVAAVDKVAGSREEQAVADDATATRPGVLFVDDEETLAQVASITLERLGFAAEVTTSSRRALEMVREDPERFDVVLSDYLMAEMNGHDLGTAIRAIRDTLQVVIITGNEESYSQRDATNSGFHYLRKPYAVAELKSAVLRAMAAVPSAAPGYEGPR